jgi:hypothetical protein
MTADVETGQTAGVDMMPLEDGVVAFSYTYEAVVLDTGVVVHPVVVLEACGLDGGDVVRDVLLELRGT